MAPTTRSVETARKRISHLAKSLGYLVTRECDEGVVTLTLFWLGPNPHIRMIEIVPDGQGEEPWPLGEKVVASGLAIPDRVTPRDVGRVLSLLVEIERSLTS
jgi:hypothetical protein